MPGRAWRRRAGQDRSVASGRSMEQIAAGNGQGAKAIHARPRRSRPTRCGSRTDGDAAEARSAEATRERAARAAKLTQRRRKSRCPEFIDPELCRWSSGRRRAPAGCMRSSSTAIACSCGSRTARPCCAPARGWTGRTSSLPSPRAATLPDVLIDGEIVALDQRRAGFRRAAGGLVRRQDRGTDFLRLRSAVRRRRRFASLPLASARRG